MMMLFSHLDVSLRVPAHIQQGLADGSLRAWGGTVRDLQGRIVALLTEGRGLADMVRQGVPFDPGPLTDAIGHAGTAAQLASGLGALNLAVNVTGFVIVKKQLDRIEGQMQRTLAELAAVREAAAWIGALQWAQIQGEIDGALDATQRAQRQANPRLFTSAKTQAFKVRRTLHHAASMMIETRRALPHHEMFADLMRASAIFAVAEAVCDEAVEGTPQAVHALGVAVRDFKTLVAAFDGQRRDFGTHWDRMIIMGSAGAARTAALSAELSAVVQQVEGVADRLAIQAASGLDAEAWFNLTAPEGSGVLTCLAAPEGAGADLRSLLRGPAPMAGTS